VEGTSSRWGISRNYLVKLKVSHGSPKYLNAVIHHSNCLIAAPAEQRPHSSRFVVMIHRKHSGPGGLELSPISVGFLLAADSAFALLCLMHHVIFCARDAERSCKVGVPHQLLDALRILSLPNLVGAPSASLAYIPALPVKVERKPRCKAPFARSSQRCGFTGRARFRAEDFLPAGPSGKK
jgi:hypothetical protein